MAQGTALLELVAVDRLWVRVPLYAGDRRQVAPGEAALVTALGEGAGTPVRATPVTGPPAADPGSASVDLFYALAAGGFRPGERVTVALPLAGRADSTPTVPLSAIVYDAQGGTWVYERIDSLQLRAAPGGRGPDRRRARRPRARPALGTLVVSVGAAELFGTEFGAGH
ncbi:MAG: hypothetical protein R2909_03620 [Gemmatimonadales bacterium]